MATIGDKELYRSGYSDRALSRWAQRILAWHGGWEPADARKMSAGRPPSRKPRDVYCFFDNTDVKLRAPIDAQSLMRKLGIAWHGGERQRKRREMPAGHPGNASPPTADDRCHLGVTAAEPEQQRDQRATGQDELDGEVGPDFAEQRYDTRYP